VTLAVNGDTLSGQVVRREAMPVSKKHRLLLTGSRWEKRWLIGRRTKPVSTLFLVINVAVMEKCCDACGEWG
jgi:hypothetical protein